MKKTKDDLGTYIQKAIKRNPKLKDQLDQFGQAWDIAYQLIEIREKAGLTQHGLAQLVGTKQSNIARLESADYTGYTLKTLEKVTKALKAKLVIKVVAEYDSVIAV